MRILITNDDGIHAEGIAVLERVARQLTSDVWVVAPQFDQSGVAHSLSLQDPLRISQISDHKFSVCGTPTDCVIMAVKKILSTKPDLILSGINNDHNVAGGITYSGTIAGAIEGTLLGIKSIAVSQAYVASSEKNSIFTFAEEVLPKLVNKLIDVTVPVGTFFNVNFPGQSLENINSTKITVQGSQDCTQLIVDERCDSYGNSYFWLVFRNNEIQLDENSDLNAIRQGYISVTPLKVDMTDYSTLQELSKSFNLRFGNI